MSANPWEDFARRSRELYEQQAELARTWLDGQSQAGGHPGRRPARARAADGHGAELRPWPSSGAPGWRSAARSAAMPCPAWPSPGQIAGETLGRFLDPMSLALVGGSQVGETIRKLTEGPRLADLGAIERRMGKVMELWLQVQQAARAYEAVVAGAWAEASQRFADRVPEAATGRRGADPAEGGAQALARHRQPDAARDPSLGAVPRGAGRAAAPRHGLPAGRARDGREPGRAGGPADAQRDRRGAPLGAGAQAPGARRSRRRRAAAEPRPTGPPGQAARAPASRARGAAA